MTENYCVSCGEEIPEGLMVCYKCLHSLRKGKSEERGRRDPDKDKNKREDKNKKEENG